MDKTICPICYQGLERLLRTDFMICADCDVAIRITGTLIKKSDRLSIYSDDWVEGHSQNPIAHDIARSTARVVGKVVPTRAKVIDIGCGSGLLVDRLARMGYQAYGLDWSEPAIQFAKEHYQGEYILANVERGLDTGMKFDIAVASHILEHLENPHEFLQSVAGILRPGGFLCIAVPNLWWFDPYVPWRAVSTIFDPEHVIGYSPRGLHNVLTRAGFRTISTTTVTRPQALLTAVGVAAYGKLFGTKDGGIPPLDSNHRKGIPQRLYGYVSSNSLFRGMTYPVLYPLAKRTEQARALRGMELIVVAGKE